MLKLNNTFHFFHIVYSVNRFPSSVIFSFLMFVNILRSSQDIICRNLHILLPQYNYIHILGMFFEQKVSRTSIFSDEFVIWSARKLFLIRVLNLPEKFSEKLHLTGTTLNIQCYILPSRVYRESSM